VRGQKSEVRSQRSEVRSQRSEVRGQKSEVRSQKSEVGGQRSEVRGQKSEVRSQKSEVRSQRSEVRSQGSEVRSQKSEVSQKAETKERRCAISRSTSEPVEAASVSRGKAQTGSGRFLRGRTSQQPHLVRQNCGVCTRTAIVPKHQADCANRPAASEVSRSLYSAFARPYSRWQSYDHDQPSTVESATAASAHFRGPNSSDVLDSTGVGS